MRHRLTMSWWLALASWLAVFAPARGAAAAPAPPAPAVTSPSAGAGQPNPARLSGAVRPTAESLDLTLDPAEDGYGGTAVISLRALARSDSFQFHSRGLSITRLALSNAAGEIAVTHALGSRERITVRPARPLEPGAYRLEIEFTQKFGTRAAALYHAQHDSLWYSFTDFESSNARQAFPCWDEPEFKIPWQLKLTVPAADLVLSNTPIEGSVTQKGRKTVSFEQTPPLPSYLVAFMCGPFDEVPVQGTSIPTRIITLKGQAPLGVEAAREVPPILAALESWFARPYPYKKLDFIAVPEYLWGAMENPGAITFLDNWILLDPAAMTDEDRRLLAGTIAHELSHMWFGDLVTMKWWDDLWLNESFASWMGDKITQQVYPEFNMPLEQLDGAARAYAMDNLVSTHAMRQHVDDNVNLDQMADALAYDKGEAVLGMFEQWVGPDAFRKGVLAYLKAHEWGNADGADLWNELSKASGLDVAAAMETFLDRPGVPLVRARIQPGGQVELSQERYQVAGAIAPGQPPWRIPVVLEFSDGKAVHTQRVLLTQTSQRVQLVPPVQPVWLHPNADERGYYHWQVAGDQLDALARAGLDERERVGYVRNLLALLAGGMLHGDEYLRGLSAFAADSSARVSLAVLDGLDQVKFAFVTDELRAPYARFIQRTLRPLMDRLGPNPAPGENLDVSQLRSRVMQTLGWDGRDEALRRSALARARAYLANPASLPPTLVDAVIRLSALSNDSTLYTAYQRKFETAQTPDERLHFLGSFGWFHDPALLDRTFDYALHGPLRPQDLRFLFFGLDTEELRERGWRWFQQHYTEFSARIPEVFRSALVRFANGCSNQRLEAARVFFSDPARAPLGTDRELSELASRVTTCVGLREREGAAVARALQTGGAHP